jgi:hypothetical protein
MTNVIGMALKSDRIGHKNLDVGRPATDRLSDADDALLIHERNVDCKSEMGGHPDPASSSSVELRSRNVTASFVK